MDWVKVEDALPVFPDAKHGVSVLVALYDPVYEEINPGRGSYVSKVLWDGKWFKSIAYGPKDFGWNPCSDIVTHWMYLPELPGGQNDND